MQILATGKWSKAEKRWKMLVALRRKAVDQCTPAPEQRPPRANVLQFRKHPKK